MDHIYGISEQCSQKYAVVKRCNAVSLSVFADVSKVTTAQLWGRGANLKAVEASIHYTMPLFLIGSLLILAKYPTDEKRDIHLHRRL
jgi:cellobiose-specific phosphotransferase system component IIC